MPRIALLVALILSMAPQFAPARTELNLDVMKSIPTLSGGRVKPIQTFAGESMEIITGRWNFQKQDPVYLLLSFLVYDNWRNEPIVKVGYLPLKEELGLEIRQSAFSISELARNPQLLEYADRVYAKSQAGDDLSPIEIEISKLMRQLNAFQDISSGHGLLLVPPPPGSEPEDDWSSIMHPAGYDETTTEALKQAFTNTLIAFRERDPSAFEESSLALQTALANLNPDPKIYPSSVAIQREIFYNEFKPFLWSWIIYLIAFFLFLLNFQYQKNRVLYWSAFGAACVGFVLHSYGLLLRSLIAARPPVSNMYETVVYVSWAILLTALVFEAVQRKRWLGAAGTIVGVGMLIMANILPFDSNIDPLVPVLRSNYWLIVHVMSITFSYGAFALAMGLAHVILCAILFTPQRKSLIRELSVFHYRVIQVGIVLLAAGTILGGVWAAESWGRFWGWDPKETWALISLLGYLAIFHARFTGWLRDFGIAVSSIIAFQLIIFTWYGVNFVLATGLHSYGFGSGGGWYVATYVLAEALFLAVMVTLFLMKNRGEMSRIDSTMEEASSG